VIDTDAEMERQIGRILRSGVYLSAACLVIGLTTSLLAGAPWFAGTLMNAGLILLMATPVARVALSVVEYRRRRDWTFVILTSIVLLELSAGVVAALVFHRKL
jgi:uncharacterized membrane protein